MPVIWLPVIAVHRWRTASRPATPLPPLWWRSPAPFHRQRRYRIKVKDWPAALLRWLLVRVEEFRCALQSLQFSQAKVCESAVLKMVGEAPVAKVEKRYLSFSV